MANAERERSGGVQDTGNPVLDSTVNIAMSWGTYIEPHNLRELHKTIAELYEAEPVKPERQRLTAEQMKAGNRT